MINLILIIFASAAIGNILCNQIIPLEDIKYNIGLSIERRLFAKNNIINYIIGLIHHLINCPSCISFWTALLLNGNILIASISYVLSALIYSKMNSI